MASILSRTSAGPGSPTSRFSNRSSSGPPCWYIRTTLLTARLFQSAPSHDFQSQPTSATRPGRLGIAVGNRRPAAGLGYQAMDLGPEGDRSMPVRPLGARTRALDEW